MTYRNFVGTKLFQQSIQLAAEALKDSGFEGIIPTNIEKIFHADHDVFTTPDIPAVKLMSGVIGGNASGIILRC